MGQKVNPKSLRLGIIESWHSKWYADGREYAKKFHADIQLKKFLREKLKSAGVVKIEIPTLGNGIETELIDEISKAVIGERNPSIYGSDSRWHSSIYPIYQAERVIKGGFYSQDVVLSIVRPLFRFMRR